jgi:hypothetical protein
MFPYQSTQYDTFMALVQASNPGLIIADLSAPQLRSLVPVTITADAFGRDTSVRLMVRPNNVEYFGTQTVTYRRINLASYLRSLTLTLDDYIGSTTMTPTQFCTAFNKKYGTALVATDIINASFTSGTQTTVTISTGSICYEGSFSVNWTQGKQYINQVISNPVLVGRIYPGGNNMPPIKPVGDFLTYNLDCTSIKTALAGLTSGAAITPTQWNTANSIYATILSFLQQNRSDLNLSGSDSATTGGLGNLVATRYTLPSASLPGANSNKFTAVVTIAAVSGSWFLGMFYLHYTA